jgi:hypothetical protein
MRVVLIEHGGERVLGDLAARDARTFELPKSAHAREDPDELAVIAARRFDESEGRYYWSYRFTPFGSRDRSDGYEVFVCLGQPDDAAQDRLEDFGVVVMECFYAGYVRCVPPPILIGPKGETASNIEDRALGAICRAAIRITAFSDHGFRLVTACPYE